MGKRLVIAEKPMLAKAILEHIRRKDEYPGTASAGLDFLCKAGRVEIEEVHCYGNR